MEYISHEDYKKMMFKFQEGTKKTILKEGLDPVGQEDSDPDNDGVKNTKSDKYILNRRKQIGKAISRAKGGRMMKEADYDMVELEPGQLNTDQDLYDIVTMLRKKGIEAGIGSRKQSDILVPFGKKKDAADILSSAGFVLKSSDIEEYNYTDNYPGSWGYREGKLSEDDYTDPANAQSGDTDAMNIAEDDEFDLTQKTPLDAQPQQPEVVQQISNTRFKIINPRGEEIEVDFDPHVDEWVDAYSGHGWLEGEDGEFMYWINADFENDGGVSPHVVGYENEVDYQELLRPNEGLHTPPLQATGPTISTVEEKEDLRYITDPNFSNYDVKPFKLPTRKDTTHLDYDPEDVSRFKPDYMSTDEPLVGDDDDDEEIEIDFDDTDFEKLPKHFQRTVSRDLSGDNERNIALRENTIANPPMGFKVLPPGVRDQLAEYIRSIKEIKKEINKIVSKTGKKVNFEEMGGDRTGLVMTSSTVSEDHSPEIEKIESKIPEKLYTITEKVLHELKKAGLTDVEIQMFIKHEIEEIGKKAIMSQHDL